MKQSFKYRLYPSKEQIAHLDFVLYKCRFLYNSALAHKKILWNGYRTKISCFEHMKELPAIKTQYIEYGQIYSQVLQEVFRRLEKSFLKMFREGAGYPRFKSKNRYRSIVYPQNGFKILESGKLRLSKIGLIRMFYHRPIEGEIKTLTLKKDNVGDWYAIFVCELSDIPSIEPKTAIGVDVGIKKLATLSNGETFQNPQFLKKTQSKLKKCQRQLSRKKRGSNNGKRAMLKLSKLHRRIERQRNDYLHKVSYELVKRADMIVFEDLTITNMLKNHYLAKSISDSSWDRLIKYTTYKAEKAGKAVKLVDPAYTTQLCSRCGSLVHKTLSVRIHSCLNCGLVTDRDVNSAINILKKVGWGTPEPIKTPVETEPLSETVSSVAESGSPRL